MPPSSLSVPRAIPTRRSSWSSTTIPTSTPSLAAAMPDVKVVENQWERGLSGGKNTGVGLAQGDIVAFLDDDAVADPDWLKFFADSYADPAIMGVGGLTLPTGRPRGRPGSRGSSTGSSAARTCGWRDPGSRSGTCWVETRPSVGRPSRRPVVSKMASADRPASDLWVVRRPSSASGSTRLSPGSVFLYRRPGDHLAPGPARALPVLLLRVSLLRRGALQGAGHGQRRCRDGLSSERHYTTRTLPRGVVRGLGDLMQGDRSGLGRAGAIVTGLSCHRGRLRGGVAANRRVSRRPAPDAPASTRHRSRRRR